MIEIKVSEELRSQCPNFVGVAIKADVQNSQFDKGLWEEIDKLTNELKAKLEISEVKNIPAIFATRTAYKAFGKDPNRYRPSAEALHRRILRNLPLYQINTLVDLINLISLKTGYSIGGFDYNLIQGTELVLGVGKADDIFEAIGRGKLNIEGLPVYRDNMGGIGTPTSDEERTKLNADTNQLVMLINAYSGKDDLDDAVKLSDALLKEYTSASNIEIQYY